MRVLYYREKETGDSKLPSLRVVAIEDLLEQVCNGRRIRMEKYLVEYGSHVPRPVIQLFLDLCQICQATRRRKSTQKIVPKPIIPDAVGHRGQADLVDLQMVPDNGYKFILNYCLSKYVILRPLRDMNKECGQWVSELPHVQYSKNTAFHCRIT